MNDKLLAYRDRIIEFWNGRSKKQKGIILGSLLLLVILVASLIMFGNRTNFVPLYSNLTLEEAGKIKEALDARGVPSEVSSNGTTISVPETMVNTLKVELAAEGFPNSGRIDYSTIQQGTGFGMTDNEFSVIERAAMQTELANLIRTIDGVRNANVMITLPEESIWVADEPEAASASVVIDLAPGYQLDQKQIRALYHLVSKSVPNLPIDNIVIMDSNFEHFEYNDENSMNTTLTVYEQQRKIKQDIEKDITRRLQQMLGTWIGRDSVLVSVTTDIDFTQENRQEELVTPVDEENMEGLVVSVETITETYEGVAGEEGVAGVGEGIPGYPGVVGGDGGTYERVEERINNEVNRIRRDIVESPYKIRDIGIQVMVEPPEGMEETPPETLEAIEQILATIVRTSIDSSIVQELTNEEIEDKIVVFSQPFNGKVEQQPASEPTIPLWMYIVGGVLLAIIIILVILLIRKNRKAEEGVEEEEAVEAVPKEIPELPEGELTEAEMKRRQLEKLAKEKPEEFAKLLRTWLVED